MTTSSPFDLLGSASFLVDDAVATTASLVDALGFPAPKPHWILPLGPTGMSARFLRPLHDTVQCPTPIELVEATPIAPDLPLEASQVQIHAIRRSQEARPVRAHATDVAAADALAFAARFERLGITHWVHLSPEGVPRVWVGVDPRDRTTYDPSLDAHLHIEVLPTSVLGLRPAAFDPLPFDAAAAGPGTMVRVAWRTFLVRDLDRTLGVVDHLLGWQPDGPVEVGKGGARRALLGFRLATSTRLELLQPGEGSDEQEALARWGEGPWSMTIAVHGLDAKAADLERRGTGHWWVETGFPTPGRVVRVARDATPGCAFDLAELAETTPPVG